MVGLPCSESCRQKIARTDVSTAALQHTLIATAGEGADSVGALSVGSAVVGKVSIGALIDLDTAREGCMVTIASVTDAGPASHIVDTGGSGAAQAAGVAGIGHTLVDIRATWSLIMAQMYLGTD